jgi:hypothetical protein
MIKKSSRRADFYASCISAVHAGAAVEQPAEGAIVFHFPELHLQPGLGREVFGIFVTTPVCGFFTLTLIPLLASHLAAAASSAFSSVVHNRFFCHRLPPELN